MTSDLFESAAACRDEAIARSRAGAGEEWIESSVRLIREISLERDTFTADDVRSRLLAVGAMPLESRAIGAALREAKRRGFVRQVICVCCGQPVRAEGVPRNHGRPMALWERKL